MQRSKADWKVVDDTYSPPYYESAEIRSNPAYADHADPKMEPRLTVRLANLERNVMIDDFGRPLNPRGRTGIQGRGDLGRWGPNHKV